MAKEDCSECDGSGDCIFCDGSGEDEDGNHCDTCDGTGVCQACQEDEVVKIDNEEDQ